MKVLGSLVFSSMFFLVFFVLIYMYWNHLRAFDSRYRFLLISLRIVVITGFILLLINPWFNFKRKTEIQRNIDVIFDHSESLKHHYDKANLQWELIRTKIEEWGGKNDVKLDVYRLGNDIHLLENMDIFDIYTDFSQLGEFMAYEHPDQLLLITDGKATIGRELTDLKLPSGIPLNILGVGDVDRVSDLVIESIDVPLRSMEVDTVNLKVTLKSYLTQEVATILEIMNDQLENIYSRTIRFESGNQVNEIKISIPAVQFSGLNTINLLPLKDEIKTNNNQYTFRVNIQSSKEEILLVSGALSLNTKVIKSTLDKIDEAENKHCFRFDVMHWNETPLNILKDNTRMIVLDDFPSDKNDHLLLNQIISESDRYQIPIVYIEGPKSNLSTGEMIRSHFPSFIPLSIDIKIATELSDESLNRGAFGVNLTDFPPQIRSVKWTIDEESWVNYSDGSFLATTKNNLFMMAAPNIANSHLKTSHNSTSSIQSLMRNIFLYAFYGNDGLLALHINKNSFDMGENVNATLIPIQNIGLTNVSFVTIDAKSDTIRSDCEREIVSGEHKCNQLLQKAGEYTLLAEAMMLDGKKVISNTEQVVVQNINIELKDLSQDQNTLMRVAHNTRGHYMGIESLDSMLANIEITPIQLIKKIPGEWTIYTVLLVDIDYFTSGGVVFT